MSTSASSSANNHPHNRTVDGSNDKYFITRSGAATNSPAWLEIDLGRLVYVMGVKVFVNKDKSGTYTKILK